MVGDPEVVGPQEAWWGPSQVVGCTPAGFSGQLWADILVDKGWRFAWEARQGQRLAKTLAKVTHVVPSGV